ncbi:unnamed protein product [Phyllotreta striolata]|uniref:Uncharacterized protein n=1 Tax=Phyllotreta striolata TaxID=444603 RepID=A0A9N9TSB4_PHYSR|nr:unnamed protein product [Phyllotreta striolata]
MTLRHSKTWPVATMAVVQLRVRPPPGEDATATGPYEAPKPPEDSHLTARDEFVRLELFARMSSRPKTVRTDTVSTILDPAEFDSDRNENCEESSPKSPPPGDGTVQKFHVLALARIEETGVDEDAGAGGGFRRDGGGASVGRRPSIKVDNWDFIYTEKGPEAQDKCPVHHYSLGSPNGRIGTNGTKDSLLPPELPLDARKTTTLRRHYYPEGGWGWVVATCAVLVHILNHGVQLAYSQLVLPGTEKFRVEKWKWPGAVEIANSAPMGNHKSKYCAGILYQRKMELFRTDRKGIAEFA